MWASDLDKRLSEYIGHLPLVGSLGGYEDQNNQKSSKVKNAHILQSNISRLRAGVLLKCLKYIPSPLLICLISSQTPEVEE